MASKRRIAALVLIGFLVSVLVTPRILLVELLETFLSKFYEEETVFASGYSWKSWDTVRVGDTEDRVIKLLGEPLRRYKKGDGRSSFLYSVQGPRNTNYRARGIVFDAGGRVIEVKAEFYFD